MIANSTLETLKIKKSKVIQDSMITVWQLEQWPFYFVRREMNDRESSSYLRFHRTQGEVVGGGRDDDGCRTDDV